MPKIEEFKASKSVIPNKTRRLSSHEQLDDFEFDDQSYNSKMKVNCICPQCGKQHVMAFHWIGRGTPRKYCQACKGGANG
jgi:ribosomal protein S27AE